MALRGVDYVRRSEALCRLLKKYRQDAGLTQRELADRLGVLQTFISKIESRERRLDVIELESYLRPLGREVRDLLDELGEAEPAEFDPADGPAELTDSVRLSGAEVTLTRVLDILNEALVAAGMRDMSATELVANVERDGAGLSEVVVDLSSVPGFARDGVELALRRIGERH